MAAQTTSTAGTKNVVAEGVESITKSFDENLERVQGLNEKFVDAAKLSGNLSLDTYEKTVTSVLDFQKSIAGATKLDWLTAVVDAQTSLVKGISTAATTAAREILK
ncbi:hypothetical protein FK531_18885 [Rhodococcus spelaei]|uniref:Phasin domain-containing protein n=1 Tax=Rhodococcus spelaei TaxID=2546320 RepID=A0A541B0X6_9NOCA|nr:hypothetical protein [Rhodococcus spelaei]TQF65950.1 hypothetical protein FK531_18885 [Rhodococcus spelaei]